MPRATRSAKKEIIKEISDSEEEKEISKKSSKRKAGDDKPKKGKKTKNEKEEVVEEEEEDDEENSKNKKISKKSAKEDKGEEVDITGLIDENGITALSVISFLEADNELDSTTAGARFAAIADTLLNKFLLMINEKPHRLGEIEFYWKGGKHDDVFSHQHEDQKRGGKWYFHKMGKGYKGGSYKGLDIAFGNKDGFGGILIRTIEPLGSKQIEGPSMCVDHILSLNGASTIPDLVGKFDSSVDKAASSPLYLVYSSKLPPRSVHVSPRVGLTMKKTDFKEEREKYIMAPYRYFTGIDKLKKGRHYIFTQLYGVDGKTVEEIVKLTGAKKDSISRCIDQFNQGTKKKVSSFFGESLTPDLTCQLHGAWVNATKQ